MTARELRTIITGVAVIVVGLLLAKGVPKVRELTARSIVIADSLERRLARVQQFQRSRAGWTDSLRAAHLDAAVLSHDLIDAASPSSGSARLAQVLADAAEAAGLPLDAVQFLPDPQANGGLLRVRVSSAMSGEFGAIVRALNTIESGLPLVAIRDLSISASGTTQTGRPESLRADFTVEGILRRPPLSPVRPKRT